MRLEHFMGSRKALAHLAALSVGQALLPVLLPHPLGPPLPLGAWLGALYPPEVSHFQQPDLQPQQIGTTLLVSVGLGVTPALPGHSL